MPSLRNSLVIIILMMCSNLYSQVSDNSYDRIYGLDPSLYNGKLYTFVAPFGSTGDQFLDSKVYTYGSATINGIRYDSLLLNYDIVNQQLLMRFHHLNGTTSIISLSQNKLDKLSLGNKDFEVIGATNKDESIYQVIGKGKLRILLSWWKVLSANNSYGSSNMVFSKPHKAMYLFMNNQIHKFKNNRSFASCFSDEKQALIKRYLRQNNYKVQKLKDAELATVIEFCNTI